MSVLFAAADEEQKAVNQGLSQKNPKLTLGASS